MLRKDFSLRVEVVAYNHCHPANSLSFSNVKKTRKVCAAVSMIMGSRKHTRERTREKR
jgi:hypothetical protein